MESYSYFLLENKKCLNEKRNATKLLIPVNILTGCFSELVTAHSCRNFWYLKFLIHHIAHIFAPYCKISQMFHSFLLFQARWKHWYCTKKLMQSYAIVNAGFACLLHEFLIATLSVVFKFSFEKIYEDENSIHVYDDIIKLSFSPIIRNTNCSFRRSHLMSADIHSVPKWQEREWTQRNCSILWGIRI